MTPSTPDAWHTVLPTDLETAHPEQLRVSVHVPHGSAVQVSVQTPSGEVIFLQQVQDDTPPREVEGVLTGQASFAFIELPPGTYTLRAHLESGAVEQAPIRVLGAEGEVARASEEASANEESEHPQVAEEAQGAQAQPDADAEAVEPEEAEEAMEGEEAEDEPAAKTTAEQSAPAIGRPDYGGRNWGISATAYALRSSQSWGVGDFADLADLAATVAAVGGDYVLLTPVVRTVAQAVSELGLSNGAGEDTGAMIIDPAYIRPEDIRETAYLPSAQRTMMDWSSEVVRATNSGADAIDFADAWENKRAALEVIFTGTRSATRQGAFERFRQDHGAQIFAYVHAAVAAESSDPAALYAQLQEDSTTGALARREQSERIDFHVWLQWVAREQLCRAQAVALDAGMRIGFIHQVPAGIGEQFLTDLAPCIGGIYLAEAHEAAPETAAAAQARGLLVFATGLNQTRRAALAESGIIPQTTLRAEYFGEGSGEINQLPEDTMLAVALNEDPPSAGALADEHLDLSRRLGILSEDYEERRKGERIMRERVNTELRAEGLLPQGATERQTIEAMHQFLLRSPARFITLTLSDAIGNRRPFVLGGAYPDWAYPYTDGAGAAVLTEDLSANARFDSLVERITTDLRGA